MTRDFYPYLVVTKWTLAATSNEPSVVRPGGDLRPDCAAACRYPSVLTLRSAVADLLCRQFPLLVGPQRFCSLLLRNSRCAAARRVRLLLDRGESGEAPVGRTSGGHSSGSRPNSAEILTRWILSCPVPFFEWQAPTGLGKRVLSSTTQQKQQLSRPFVQSRADSVQNRGYVTHIAAQSGQLHENQSRQALGRAGALLAEMFHHAFGKTPLQQARPAVDSPSAVRTERGPLRLRC